MDQNYSIKNQIRQERIDFIKSFFRNAAFGLILIFIAVGILVASNIMNGRFQTTLGAKIDEVNTLNHQLTANLAKTQHQDSVAQYASTGIDWNRKAKDDEIVKTILDNYANWSSDADRTSKMKDFGERYKEGSMLGGFYYVIYASVNGGIYDVDGVHVDYHNTTGWNQTYNDFNSYVVKIDNGNYYYETMITVTRTLSNGPKTSKVLLSYWMEESGRWHCSRTQYYIVE